MSTGDDRTGREDLDRPVAREPLGTTGDRDRRDARGPVDDLASLEDRPRRDADLDRREGDLHDSRRVEDRDGRTGQPAPARDAQDPALEPEPRGGGKTAAIWISLILGAIVLILLLIFVIQNNVPATFQYFTAEFDLPLGVAMLLAAIAGALVMALVGSVRMIQMGWTIRKLRKQQERIQRAVR